MSVRGGADGLGDRLDLGHLVGQEAAQFLRRYIDSLLNRYGDTPQNQAILWRLLLRAYENAGDRETKRAAMWADPEWLAYTQERADLGALEAQENRLMTPVSFFPIER